MSTFHEYSDDDARTDDVIAVNRHLVDLISESFSLHSDGRPFSSLASNVAHNATDAGLQAVAGLLQRTSWVLNYSGKLEDDHLKQGWTPIAVSGGITVTPPSTILEFDGSGFDATQVRDATVVKVGSNYDMLYAGLSFANPYQVGLATSTDGATWTKYSSDPVIYNTASPSWTSFRELPVTLIYEKGTYKLWLNGNDTNLSTDAGRHNAFGYATSQDGINWTIDPTPIRTELNGPDGKGYDLREVVKFGGQYHAYFVHHLPTGDVLEHAISNDGVTFTEDAPVAAADNYIFQAATTVIVDGAKTIFALWQDSSGIDHYATSTDGIHFALKGTMKLPSDFNVTDVLIDNGEIKIYGDKDVGNINWGFGNTVIEYATATIPGLYNFSPIVIGPSMLTYSTHQTISGSQLFTSATDQDGSVADIRFWDSTPGAGYLTLDGEKISGSHVDVSLSDVDRVAYVTGAKPGGNDIAIDAYDQQGLISNDLSVRINIVAPDTNQAPIVIGPSTLTYSTHQTISGSQLFTSATDQDGSVADIRFWDSTPGAGYLTLDGEKISGSHVDVSLSDVDRVAYVTGAKPGGNDIAIDAYDQQGLISNDLSVRINIVAPDTNQAPIVIGPSTLTYSSGQTIPGSQLFTSATDQDGSVDHYIFRDATPGQGYLTLDGQRITTDSVTVDAGDLDRVAYKTGNTDGYNDIVIDAVDNQGASSADFALHVIVGNGEPAYLGVNALTDYVDATPGNATWQEVVAVARGFVGHSWSTDLCTGFLWAVAYEAGAYFFDKGAADRPLLQDATHVADTNFIVPDAAHSDEPWDQWESVSLPSPTDWFDVVKPGDFVRVDISGQTFSAHSFIVTKVEGEGTDRKVWVIDNYGGVPESHGQKTQPIGEYELDRSATGFELSVINAADGAWVQRLHSASASAPDNHNITSWAIGDEVHVIQTSIPNAQLEVSGPMSAAMALHIGTKNASWTVVNSDTGNTLLNAGGYKELLINGGIRDDTVTIGSLSGAGIAAHTVFFAGGNGRDHFNATGSGRSLVASGGDGNDVLGAGSGNDILAGNAGNDTIRSGGGSDHIKGGSGNDSITFGSFFTLSDKVDGGPGNDKVELDGDYSRKLILSSSALANIEAITLGAHHSYNLKTNDANVKTGASLFIDGSKLASQNAVHFDGSTETNGSFRIYGGSGEDVIVGGKNADILLGGDGADHLKGNGGNDDFVYKGVSQSTGSHYDTIIGFDFKHSDVFDLAIKISTVQSGISSGTLRSSHFDSDLAAAVGSHELGVHDAIEFKVSRGDLSGETFLIVDANGHAGYQAAHDYVFLLDQCVHMSSVDVSDFI